MLECCLVKRAAYFGIEKARVNRGGSARALWFASILFLVSVAFLDHDVFEVEAFSLEYLPNYVEAFPV